MAEYKYLKVSPRGFANEVTYYRVPLDKVAEANAAVASYEDDNVEHGGYACWTTDKSRSDQAVKWEDRDPWAL